MSELPTAWRNPAKFEGTLRSLTTTERDNLPSPLVPLLIWNSTDGALQGYNGSAWFSFPDSISLTEIGFLDGVTAGTATASKAVVLGASKEIATITSATITTLTSTTVNATNVAFAAGATFDADHGAVSATGNDTTQSATVTKAWGTITTGSLTTAAAGSTDVVLTLTGVTAGDPVFVTPAGGTNTRTYEILAVITTTNTITVTIRNVDLINALNGTIKFYYFWVKA